MSNSYPKSQARKPSSTEEVLGQVYTPLDIAEKMVKLLFSGVINSGGYSLLDPAVGPATFPRVIVENGFLDKNSNITTIDIDQTMTILTDEWLTYKGIEHETINTDYLVYDMERKFDYAIFNPPYIRQEWIEDKQSYQTLFKVKYNIDIPGTSNLYVYFVVKAILNLKASGTFVCILYDSWQYTKYGKWLQGFIKQTCQNVEVYPLEDKPFQGKMINATIVKGVKAADVIRFSGQSDICVPNQMLDNITLLDGFSPIKSIFCPKRGLRLKQADFFLSDQSMIKNGATPFLKKIGRIKGYSVPEQHTETALLVWNASMDKRIITELERRLQIAKSNPTDNISVLAWYGKHPNTWYIHPEPPFSSIVFNYYIRNRPRHLHNPDRAYSDNFYGLAVSDTMLLYAYISVLNSTAVCNNIVKCSRRQGNGLYKIQLFEYKEVLIPDIGTLSNREVSLLSDLGKSVVECPHKSESIIRDIDYLLWNIYQYDELNPEYAIKLLETKIR